MINDPSGCCCGAHQVFEEFIRAFPNMDAGCKSIEKTCKELLQGQQEINAKLDQVLGAKLDQVLVALQAFQARGLDEMDVLGTSPGISQRESVDRDTRCTSPIIAVKNLSIGHFGVSRRHDEANLGDEQVCDPDFSTVNSSNPRSRVEMASLDSSGEVYTQTGSVLEYIRRFEDLKERMLSVNEYLTERYFTTNFVLGLNGTIKSLIRTDAPKSLEDTIERAKFHEIALMASSDSYVDLEEVTEFKMHKEEQPVVAIFEQPVDVNLEQPIENGNIDGSFIERSDDLCSKSFCCGASLKDIQLDDDSWEGFVDVQEGNLGLGCEIGDYCMEEGLQG